MTRDEILKVPSMPAFAPSYPHGPFCFVRREYLIITYETDPNAIRAALPEPLEPAAGALAFYEWMKMPDASGFGDYEESGTGIYATFKGEPCNFSVQMYLDDEPPITGGREIWGFPKKYGIPRLKVIKDTLTGTLHYDDERVAMGTMAYKQVICARRGSLSGLLSSVGPTAHIVCLHRPANSAPSSMANDAWWMSPSTCAVDSRATIFPRMSPMILPSTITRSPATLPLTLPRSLTTTSGPVTSPSNTQSIWILFWLTIFTRTPAILRSSLITTSPHRSYITPILTL